MWFDVKNLREALEALPEPILIVGNRIPDGDSLGSCVAVLEYLRSLGMEAYIHCATPLEQNLSWMLQEEDSCSTILEDYESLIVLDDMVNSPRLGIPIKPDVPIICIDHHLGNFPEALRNSIIASDKQTIFSEGHVLYFYALKPATACLLIDQDIYHPFLWVSLFTDTVGFTVQAVTATRYANRLIESLSLSDVYVEWMLSKIKDFATAEDYESLISGSSYTMHGVFNEAPVSLLVVAAEPQSGTAYRNMLTALRNFGDVVIFINRLTGQTSFRSSLDSFNVMEIAKEFGGGGHFKAAGATLRTEDLNNQIDRLLSILSNKIDNSRIKWFL